MTHEERDKLQDEYVHQLVDDMDFKTLYSLVYDYINRSLDDYTANELVLEIKEHYPHLLEDN